MIKQFKQFFEKHLSPAVGADEPADEQRLQLAAAALLVEMTRADGELRDVEQQVVERAIASRFALSPEQTRELIQLAEAEISDATCYHQFTSLINQHYTQTEKAQLVASFVFVIKSEGKRAPNSSIMT